MSWLDDFFGSSPLQQPGNPSGESDADRRMREHDQALAQLRADRKLTQFLASQEVERASAPFDRPASISADRLWIGIHPTPLGPLNDPDALRNPPNDARLNPSDDWQKRGRDTAAMALSILYPKDGPIPIAANQPSNMGNGFQPIPSGQLWAGVRPAPLTPLNYPNAYGLSDYVSGSEPAPTPVGQYASNDRSIPEQFRMVTSPAGRRFIQRWEAAKGPVLPTYPDIAGHPTIGYGHKLTPGDTWLYQQFPNGIGKLMADTFFNQDLQNAEDAVYHAVGNGLSQNQFDSLVSFVFNEGRDALARSVLAQRTKSQDFAGAANEFSKWVYARSPTGAGKIKSQGLINRRKEEEALFRYGTNPY